MQVLDIQGYSYEQGECFFRNLTRILVNAGGWIVERRTLSANNSELTLEVELRFILDLYAGLISSGLELTRADHLALTDLCTCRLHLMGNRDVRQVIGIRIEISFLKQLSLDNLLMTGCSTA
jgi:hypothetical protein